MKYMPALYIEVTTNLKSKVSSIVTKRPMVFSILFVDCRSCLETITSSIHCMFQVAQSIDQLRKQITNRKRQMNEKT